MCIYVYASVVVEDLQKWNAEYFAHKSLCLCLCCCKGYVHMQVRIFLKRSFVYMLVLLYRVCTHARMGFLAKRLPVIFLVFKRVFTQVRLGILRNSLGAFWQNETVFIYLLSQRVCTHVRLIMLLMYLCVYVCVIVEGIYTFKTGYSGICPLYLYSCFCRGYVQICA